MTDQPWAWTGATATRLQQALRLSSDDFAHRLGVAPRTVATWHAQPSRVPRPEIQRALDTALDLATPDVRARFGPVEPPAQTAAGLHVAVAVVVRGDHVLLVQRRDADLLSWQFPAGVVKPENSAGRVAVQETKSETGIDCAVSRQIGARVHPITNVYCVYFLCDYLTGEAINSDVVENASVIWAPIRALARFIPLPNIYPPILDTLGANR